MEDNVANDNAEIKINSSFLPYGAGMAGILYGLYKANKSPLPTNGEYLKTAAIWGGVGVGVGWLVGKLFSKGSAKSKTDAGPKYEGKDQTIYDLFNQIGQSRPEITPEKINIATEFVAKNFNEKDKDVLIEFYSFVANASKQQKDMAKVLNGAVESVRTKYGQDAISNLGKKMMDINKILTNADGNKQ